MGFGNFLKRVTTVPSKGPLSGLRKVFGKNWADEVGMGVGFALGGPAGAGIGAGLGDAAHNQNVGKALVAGGKGYLAGTGAAKLGIPGNAAGFKYAQPLSGVRSAISSRIGSGGVRTATDGVDQTTPGRGGGFLGDMSDFEKATLALQGLGAVASTYGAHRTGQAEDREYAAGRDDIAYQRERHAMWDPMRMKLAESVVNRRRV